MSDARIDFEVVRQSVVVMRGEGGRSGITGMEVDPKASSKVGISTSIKSSSSSSISCLVLRFLPSLFDSLSPRLRLLSIKV